MNKNYLAAALGFLLAIGWQSNAQAAEIVDDHGKMQHVKVVDLENHFTTDKLLQHTWALPADKTGGTTFSALSPNLKDGLVEERDLDSIRLAAMDKAGIDYIQISLTTPSAEIFDVELGKEIATDANNRLGEAIRKHPDRIGGYMTLVPGDVEWSLKEIDRCLAMGLWGWSSMSNYAGTSRLDDPKYLPLLARCNELKMPIFLHPYFPADKQITEAGYILSGPNFGFTVDTQLTFLRMIFRGIFDKYPDLKIILGHTGEGLAIYEDRVNTAYRQMVRQPNPEFGHLEHAPSYYLHHNLYGDTSGSFRSDVVHFTRQVFGDHFLVFGTDYSKEDAKAAVDLIAKDPQLPFAAKKAILQDNAASIGIGFSHLK